MTYPHRPVCISRLVAAILAIAMAFAIALVLPSNSHAVSRSCVISPTANAAAYASTAPLRFGIYPGGPAGSVNPKNAPRPENPAKRLSALQELRGDQPFVVRLYAGWTGDASADDVSGWLDDDIADYTAQGLQVELVIRYKPNSGDAGSSPAAFARYVRGLVRRYGPDKGFTSLQVTNEANLTGAPEASDGAFPGARQALVEGIIAAKDEARTNSYDQLGIGFSWAYDERPSASSGFWTALRRLGGRSFATSVDWVGLDSYPGTWTPQLPMSNNLPGLAARAVTDSLRSLRDCYLPMAGLGNATALHVAENGFPTGPGRSEQMQSQVLNAMVQAVSSVASKYGVTDYRWFDLRDSSTSDQSMESRYGITRDDYSPKPGFFTFRDLIARYGAGGPSAQAASARTVAARTGCQASPVQIDVSGLKGTPMTSLSVKVGKRVLKTINRRGVTRRLRVSLASGRSAIQVKARASGRLTRTVRRTYKVC